MIVAIANTEGQRLKNLLAANLAVLRARNGRRICMIDTDPRREAYRWSCERGASGQGPSVPARTLAGRSLPCEIAQLSDAYGDLLINTGGCDTQETRAALIAARVVVVPLAAGRVSLDSGYGLIARLNCARMFNPGLKVLFVMVSDGKAPCADDLAAARMYAAHVMSAHLATTVIHSLDAREYGQGRCVCDAQTCDPEAAAELHALYREIYVH